MNNPTLQTIRIIEDVIMRNSGVYSKYQVWQMLPKKMMYQTYQEVIAYLSWAKRIEHREGKIHWIFEGEQ